VSRAAWAGILLLGAGAGLVLFLLTRGLPDEVKAQAQAVETSLQSADQTLASARKDVEALVAKDSAYLAKRPEVAAVYADIKQRQEAVVAARASYEGDLAKLIKKDRHKDANLVFSQAIQLSNQASTASANVDQLLAPVQKVLHYKTHHPKLVQQAQEKFRGAEALGSDADLQARVTAATVECPTAKTSVDKQYATLAASSAQLGSRFNKLNLLAAAQPVDYVAAGQNAEAVVTTANSLRKGHQALRTDLDSLSRSEDRILVDMRESSGTYSHKYKVVKNGIATETGWVPVSHAAYSKHREHLGMAVQSKPECVPASEAVEVASPPGYAYIGNPRYGQWERRNGGSFWVFYGRYALMRDVFWGRSHYRPIRRTTWRSYRSNVGSGRPYYGATKQYGSSGTRTKTRYANSSFVKKRAQTKYRSSSYSGSSSRSSGSRSGTSYRSSRSRSSSFGGSGK
jgi:hypothetical protein